MVNEQALAEVGRWIAEVNSIEAGLGLLMKLEADIVAGTQKWPLKLDLAGSALDGFSTYKEYLTKQIRDRELEIVRAAISQANADLKVAVFKVQAWSAKL